MISEHKCWTAPSVHFQQVLRPHLITKSDITQKNHPVRAGEHWISLHIFFVPKEEVKLLWVWRFYCLWESVKILIWELCIFKSSLLKHSQVLTWEEIKESTGRSTRISPQICLFNGLFRPAPYWMNNRTIAGLSTHANHSWTTLTYSRALLHCVWNTLDRTKLTDSPSQQQFKYSFAVLALASTSLPPASVCVNKCWKIALKFLFHRYYSNNNSTFS